MSESGDKDICKIVSENEAELLDKLSEMQIAQEI